MIRWLLHFLGWDSEEFPWVWETRLRYPPRFPVRAMHEITRCTAVIHEVPPPVRG